MLLSFIIPAYNSGSFIIDTLDSICQEIRSSSQHPIEIVVVNDGSTDNTDEVVRKYISSNKDINIHLFYKENGGLSDARNFGIGKSKGEFIWFFDSDDLIEPKVLPSIVERLIENQLDLLSLGVREFFEDEDFITNMSNKPINKIVDGICYIQYYDIEHSACAYIIRRSLLVNNDIYFIKGVLSEDYDFNWRLYEKCRRISHLGDVAYRYIIRKGSLSRRNNKDYYRFHHESMVKILKHSNSYFSEINNSSYYKGLRPHFSQLKTIALITLLKSNLFYREKISYLSEMEANGIYDLCFYRGMTYKQKIIVFLVKSKLRFMFPILMCLSSFMR